FKSFILLALLVFTCASFAFAQKTEEKNAKKENKQQAVDPNNLTAEQVAESAIVIYGGGGRENLNRIRKTAFERGKMIINNPDGTVDNANYERWVIRADSLEKERIRFEQQFPNTRFALIYDGEKLFGLFNETVFTPKEDAGKAFENQIWHGLEALLRYKENESKIELAKRDKIMGVDFYLLDVTDKQNRKTRFYISAKTYRVMMLEYQEDGTKYTRRFYDYNYAQGTLVPYRTVLWADDKQIEETEIQTITFGQRVEENMFRGS
ncbi:MAG TPA: hypothetical protein VK892_14545, partial [Pyrinomonadaceae bacterium]|nr:hypothetical protein [Pyrinomonadaceae bacterium]